MMTSPPLSAFSSRPVYATLTPRPCTAALMIADAPGAAALSTLADAAPDLMTRATVLLCDADAALIGSPAPADLITTDSAGLEAAIDALMADARMGLQVWLAGDQGLIGRASARLMAHGLPVGAIQSEHRGSLARRMQCVHCKTVTDGVTTDPYTCPGCGRALFVRDHFSRRLGAFQGVSIDAETPGDVPPAQEIRS